MNYNEACNYIEENVKGLGSKPGLDCVQELLKRIGNPEKTLSVIHIAGTNGKGSTGVFLQSVLNECGYKTGHFSSPALLDFREMITVNGKMIPKTKVGEGYERIIYAAKEMVAEGLRHPTEFEMQTALAFWYFYIKQTDFVILECGMGGLFDATNVIEKPLVTVFTSISLDHAAYLGETVSQIAENKAGIMRKNVPCVSAPQEENVAEILSRKAKELGNDFSMVQKEEIIRKPVKAGSAVLRGQTFSFRDKKQIKLSLLGYFQPENAATALLVLEELKKQGVLLRDDGIRKGLEKAYWPGRFEVIGRNPVFITDGAHNPDAVAKLMATLDLYFTNRRIIYIMSVLKDKEYSTMLELSAKRAAAIITVTSPMRERALPALDLAMAIRPYNPNVTAVDSVEEAVEMALLMAGREDVILGFGSLSYLGALKKAYEMRENHDR